MAAVQDSASIKQKSLVQSANQSIIDSKVDALKQLDATFELQSSWLEQAFKDTRKRLRMNEPIVFSAEESPKSRARKDASSVLAPIDPNVSTISKSTAKGAAADESSIARMSPLVQKSAKQGTSDTFQPSIDAAKLFVSKLKYKDLQNELKARGLSAKGSTEILQERLFSTMVEEILTQQGPAKSVQDSSVIEIPSQTSNSLKNADEIGRILSPMHTTLATSSPELKAVPVPSSVTKPSGGVFSKLLSGTKSLLSSKKSPMRSATKPTPNRARGSLAPEITFEIARPVVDASPQSASESTEASPTDEPTSFSAVLDGSGIVESLPVEGSGISIKNGEEDVVAAVVMDDERSPDRVCEEESASPVQMVETCDLSDKQVCQEEPTPTPMPPGSPAIASPEKPNLSTDQSVTSTNSESNRSVEEAELKPVSLTSEETQIAEASVVVVADVTVEQMADAVAVSASAGPIDEPTVPAQVDVTATAPKATVTTKPSNLVSGLASFTGLMQTDASHSRPPKPAAGNVPSHAQKLEQIREKQAQIRLQKERERQEKETERLQRIQKQKDEMEHRKKAEAKLQGKSMAPQSCAHEATLIVASDMSSTSSSATLAASLPISSISAEESLALTSVQPSAQPLAQLHLPAQPFAETSIEHETKPASREPAASAMAESSLVRSMRERAEADAAKRAAAAAKLSADQAAADEYDSYCMSEPEEQEKDEDDDEAQKKKSSKLVPLWASKEHLRAALQRQGTLKIDPDTIFFECNTCNLEEIFERSSKRYHKRTSSANWTDDKLSIFDKLVYKRSVGIAE